MTDPEQTQAFADDVQRLINRYRAEFEMTAASVVGVLAFQQYLIMSEMQERFQDGEFDEQKP